MNEPLMLSDEYAAASAPTESVTPGLPASLPFGHLNAEKPPAGEHERGYTPKVWKELSLLYRGGYAIQAEAEKFLPKCVDERDARYKERIKLAAYIGYFGQIVSVYAASLFQHPVTVAPAADAKDPATPGEFPEPEVYEDFGTNADLRGASFSEVLRGVSTTALVKGKGLIGCDFPSAPNDTEVVTRADSDKLGLARPYCYEILPEELIDWEYDEVARRSVDLRRGEQKLGSVEFEVGKFSWTVQRREVCRRPSPSEPRGDKQIEFKIWLRGDDGVVRWAVYRTEPIKHGQMLDKNTPVKRVAHGDTQFREIPIAELRLPDPLWLGNVVGPLNKEHWQRRSGLLSAQQRTLLAIGVINLGKEISEIGGPMPAEVQTNPARGEDAIKRARAEGWTVIGSDDKIGFAAPPSDSFETVDKQLDKLVDEIHRVSGRMAASVSSTANAVGRSGASKQIDQADFTTVLMALGVIVSDAGRRTYEIVSKARGEDVSWTVHGLDQFEIGGDREALVKEAVALGTVDIRSKTFATEYRARTANQLLPGLSPDTRAQIRKEIGDSITEESLNPPPVVTDPTDDDDDEAAADEGGAASRKPGKPGDAGGGGKPPSKPPANGKKGAGAAATG